jgi:hypothetical protein
MLACHPSLGVILLPGTRDALHPRWRFLASCPCPLSLTGLLELPSAHPLIHSLANTSQHLGTNVCIHLSTYPPEIAATTRHDPYA